MMTADNGSGFASGGNIERVEAIANFARQKLLIFWVIGGTLTAIIIACAAYGLSLVLGSLDLKPIFTSTATGAVVKSVSYEASMNFSTGTLFLGVAAMFLLSTVTLFAFRKTRFFASAAMPFVLVPFILLPMGASLVINTMNTDSLMSVYDKADAWGVKQLGLSGLSSYAPAKADSVQTFGVTNDDGKQVSFTAKIHYGETYTTATYEIKPASK